MDYDEQPSAADSFRAGVQQKFQVFLDRSTVHLVPRWIGFARPRRAGGRRAAPARDAPRRPRRSSPSPSTPAASTSSTAGSSRAPAPRRAARARGRRPPPQGTYGLGIFLLNNFIGFLSPQVDPESDGPLLPVSGDGDFKPFSRRARGPRPPGAAAATPRRRARAGARVQVLVLVDEGRRRRLLHDVLLRLRRARAAPGPPPFAAAPRDAPAPQIPVFWPILLIYFFALFFLTMKRQIKHMIKHKYVPWSWGKKSYLDGGGTARPAKDDK